MVKLSGINKVYAEKKFGLRTTEDKSEKEPLKHCQGFFGPCENNGKWIRQNTAYADDNDNWRFYCDECQKEADSYWQDMWDDYYSSCL